MAPRRALGLMLRRETARDATLMDQNTRFEQLHAWLMDWYDHQNQEAFAQFYTNFLEHELSRSLRSVDDRIKEDVASDVVDEFLNRKKRFGEKAESISYWRRGIRFRVSDSRRRHKRWIKFDEINEINQDRLSLTNEDQLKKAELKETLLNVIRNSQNLTDQVRFYFLLYYYLEIKDYLIEDDYVFLRKNAKKLNFNLDVILEKIKESARLDLNIAQFAEMIGISGDTLRKNLNRASRTLKDAMLSDKKHLK